MTKATTLSALPMALLLAGVLIAFGCDTAGTSAKNTAHAQLIDGQGNQVARAEFTETDGGVKMELTVENLKTGSYTAQIHEMGECKAPDFISAGAPYPPPEEIAMVESVAGPQKRSVAQFQVMNGSAEVDAVIPVVTLREGANSLFHPGGTALVIDTVSPAGSYEGRVACGVVTETPQHEAGLAQGDIKSARQPDNVGTPGKKYARPQAEPVRP